MAEQIRATILTHLCYTEQVYGRINKKLATSMSRDEAHILIRSVKANELNEIKKIGKNYYIYDEEKQIRITINSHTCREITVDQISV